MDKFYANNAWVHLFQDSYVRHLPRTHSDHCPLLLNLTKPFQKSNSKFKLETMWLQHPDFSRIVIEVWLNQTNYPIGLKCFTESITHWNLNTFGNIFYKKSITI